MGVAYAIVAYAAKVLKELHESQVIAGKGAGTMCAYFLPEQVTDFTQCREAVGLSCGARPRRRHEPRRSRRYGQGDCRPPRNHRYRSSQRKAPARKPHLCQCYTIYRGTPWQRIPVRIGEEGDDCAVECFEVWKCEAGVAGGEGGGRQGVEGVVEEGTFEAEDLHGALGSRY